MIGLCRREVNDLQCEVSLQRPYTVEVKNGILSQIGPRLSTVLRPCKVALVSDSRVSALYGETVINSLSEAGFHPVPFILPEREDAKNWDIVGRLIEDLSAKGFHKGDCILNLGGGSVSDAGGFTASVYCRGIPYVNVPTTTLSMVDASVGGKTAVNCSVGKNLAGTIYQPSFVLCDPETLTTLPAPLFREGMAEVIKTAVVGANGLWECLENNSPDMESLIFKCVQFKAKIVAQDEQDTGTRMILNLGHTLGHAIEAKSDYQILHGEAVAIGLAVVAYCSYRAGICEKETWEKIIKTLRQFQLPTESPYPLKELIPYLNMDKKHRGDQTTLIVPTEMTKVRLMPMNATELQSFFEQGLPKESIL